MLFTESQIDELTAKLREKQPVLVRTVDEHMKRVIKEAEEIWGGRVHICITLMTMARTNDGPLQPVGATVSNSVGNDPGCLLEMANAIVEAARMREHFEGLGH